MGIYCTPFVADLFLLSFSDNNPGDLIKASNFMSRYIDDLLNSDNHYFEHIVGQIYPTELQLNKTNSFGSKAPCLNLDLARTNGIVPSKLYDKWEYLNLG